MPKASGIPTDDVTVHRDEMDSGEDTAVRSARGSAAPACLATHFIVRTHVEHTSDDADLYHTYEDVIISVWVVPSEDAHVTLVTHPGTQRSAQMWDNCLATIERNDPAALMAQLVTHVDSSTFDATYLASDKPGERVPRHPGHMDHIWDDGGTDLVDLIYSDHVDPEMNLYDNGV